MKLLPTLAAMILAATVQAHGQNELDSLKDGLQTSTPAPAVTPKPTAAPRTATTTAVPRSTPAPTAAPRGESIREQLAHGNFVTEHDLSSMAGKKVAANTFLTGTFKGTGQQSGGRREFGDAGLLKGGTKLLIRFPGSQDPRIFQAGYSSRWEKAAPLRVESVSSTGSGITVYCTDVVAP